MRVILPFHRDNEMSWVVCLTEQANSGFGGCKESRIVNMGCLGTLNGGMGLSILSKVSIHPANGKGH